VKVGRFLRERLRAKVLALVVGILVLGFGLLLALNLGRERHALEERHRETARLLAASILTAVENGMIEARPDIIRRLLQELRAQLRDVRRIDIHRRNGVEAFTDLETVEAVNAGSKPSPTSRRSKRSTRTPAWSPSSSAASRGSSALRASASTTRSSGVPWRPSRRRSSPRWSTADAS
jgi:hypothetical protein